LERGFAQLSEEYNPEIKVYFSEVQSKKDYDVNDVEAGREYVAA
jgi:hypothetical protein